MPQKYEDWHYSEKWAIQLISYNHEVLQEKSCSILFVALPHYQKKQAQLLSPKCLEKQKKLSSN